MLQEILAGDLDRHDPRVLEHMGRDPDFERRLSELELVSQWLEEGGTEQRAVLREAEQPRGTEGEALVERLLERHRRRRRWPIFVAAVAATVLVTAFLWTRAGDTAPRPLELTVLGEGMPAGLYPVGGVPAYSGFAWNFDLPDGGWFVVAVSSPEDDRELHRTPPLYEATWTPAPLEREAWPDRIHWTVTGFDATGSIVWSDGDEAWRSR